MDRDNVRHIDMKLEGIMLTEINQTKTKTAWYYLHMESKRKRKEKKES